MVYGFADATISLMIFKWCWVCNWMALCVCFTCKGPKKGCSKKCWGCNMDILWSLCRKVANCSVRVAASAIDAGITALGALAFPLGMRPVANITLRRQLNRQRYLSGSEWATALIILMAANMECSICQPTDASDTVGSCSCIKGSLLSSSFIKASNDFICIDLCMAIVVNHCGHKGKGK